MRSLKIGCLVAGMLAIPLSACRPAATSDASENDNAIPTAYSAVEVARRPTSRAGHEESMLWRASRYEQLQTAARRSGASFGVLIAASSATDVCITDTYGIQSALNAQRNDAAFSRSLADIRTFQARFCPDPRPLEGHAEESAEMRRRVVSGDAEARLVSTLLEVDPEMGVEDRSELRRAAEVMSKKADSPALYESIQIILLDERFFDPAQVTDRPFGMNHDTLRDAWEHAVVLASCERFQHCGPGSLMVYRLCIPQHCRPGLDVKRYVRDRLSADAYAEAQRRARYLLAQF